MPFIKFGKHNRLNNGAEILGFKGLKGRHWIVLAKQSESGVETYVTWAVDDNGDAYWGHYFTESALAYDDWKKRSL